MSPTKFLAETGLHPCDEFCPMEGLSCGLPESSDIKHGLEKGAAWMCHSNPSRYCCTTRYHASELKIDLGDPHLRKITESEELFAIIEH